MDPAARKRWYDYSRARDLMLKNTDTPIAPWYIVRKVTQPNRSSKGEYHDQASIARRRFVVQRY